MIALQGKVGSRAPGLLIGGLVAGALGLAFSAGNTSATSSPATDRGAATGGSSGQYGMPSDTGVAPSATGGSSRSSAGTGNPASSGKYGSGMEGSASLPPNIAPGWKIRVCSEKTKADQIHFRFTMADSKGKFGAKGTAGAEGTGYGGSSDPAKDASVNAALSDQSVSWSRGEPTEIKAPADLRDAEKIRIEATPAQKDKKASICVIYNDHVVKKMNFDDKEVSTIKSTDNGECGC